MRTYHICAFMDEVSHKDFAAGGEMQYMGLRRLLWMYRMKTFQESCQLRFVRPGGDMHLAEISNNAVEVALKHAALPSDGPSTEPDRRLTCSKV